jgi:metal transporter CNNM
LTGLRRFREGNRKAIMGLILVKELVLINPADNTPVSSLRLRELPRLAADTPMYDMLKLFETGKSHMAVLTRAPGGPPLSPGGGAALEPDFAPGSSVIGGRKPGEAARPWEGFPARIARCP